MQQIYFYCGNWKEVTKRDDVEGIVVIGQHTETPAEMSEKGRQLLRTAISAAEPVRVFCNNDYVLNGLRVAVKETLSGDVAAKVEFIYVNAGGGVHYIGMNSDGRLLAWPKGFFDQIEIDLMKLLKFPK